MPEEELSQVEIAAEAKKNADAIEDTDATRHEARGNVHSETEEAIEQGAPPPLPI